MKINACWLTTTLLLSSSTFAAPHWGYAGAEGPEHWASLTPEFAACSGHNQSPVDIKGTIKSALAPLTLHYQTGATALVNNGHTIQVDYAPGSTLTLDGKAFTLKQFHFHAPSENLIQGRHYPLEAHLVHASEQGALLVLAVMFEVGAGNPLLTTAWRQIPTQSGTTATLTRPLDVRALLPRNLDYYRFNGSLTTPPCSEGVRWLVLKHPVTASQAQIDAFKAVMHHPNNRPAQPLGARTILE
ncbi:carbonic anhydrase [Aeromonas schubertii]|uniref:carbonic anhydrase n=1 Tax=Aeromonas schubertii TaxID=652 RepID=UPI001CC516B7|nr:carbonic anhydrase family protein [Aeromonas schubertii]MBZ6072190.1 carbonic anhydrase family protein [Aeromonas schubertii]